MMPGKISWIYILLMRVLNGFHIFNHEPLKEKQFSK